MSQGRKERQWKGKHWQMSVKGGGGRTWLNEREYWMKEQEIANAALREATAL